MEIAVAVLGLAVLALAAALFFRGRAAGGQAGAGVERAVREEIAQNRRETGESLKNFNDSMLKRFDSLADSNEKKLEAMRQSMDRQLQGIQQSNEKKLEEMRLTVDEKLHDTLETRLNKSFQVVSDRLAEVHKGLGEMQNLATGVGDLKKVLTNVKTRGVFGELQLENILNEILTPDQFEKNVATKKRSKDRVEFAIKLPGAGDGPVWLPVDSKFPSESYDRLVKALEAGDAAQADAARKELTAALKEEARCIRDKYVDPPNTTDFAILFLPFESLYADVVRMGLLESFQRDFRVTIAGPTTFAAVLNALTLGFRTLVIQKRSKEVWSLLGAVKTEFERFGAIIEKTKQKIQDAGDYLDDASKKTARIQSRLKAVEEPREIVDAQALSEPAQPETEKIS